MAEPTVCRGLSCYDHGGRTGSESYAVSDVVAGGPLCSLFGREVSLARRKQTPSRSSAVGRAPVGVELSPALLLPAEIGR